MCQILYCLPFHLWGVGVYVYVHVKMYVHILCASVWRPKVYVWCLPQLLLLIFPLNLELTDLSRLAD